MRLPKPIEAIRQARLASLAGNRWAELGASVDKKKKKISRKQKPRR